MSILLPVLAPLGGGAAFTIATLYLLATDALDDTPPRRRSAAGVELAGQ